MVKGFWKGRKVLITGHEGFLGSWLARTLLDSGAVVIGLDKVKNRPVSILEGLRKDMICIKGDISNLKLVDRVIAKYRPRIIFHLAAEAIVGEANRHPVKAFKSNIEGTWNVLEASRDKKFIKAIVVASSDKAYGSHAKLPYREDTALKGSHPYDASKSCADLIAYTYFNTYKLPVCVTRCGNIYGEGDFHFSRLVPDTIRCALGGKKLMIRSDGKFIRDYIYARDVAEGYMALAEVMVKKKIYGEAFNLSYERPVSVLELVKIIYKMCGKKPSYKILNEARYEIKKQYLSAKKANKIINWQPQYAIEEGLKRTISWYRKLYGEG